MDNHSCASGLHIILPTMTTKDAICARIRAIRIAKGLSLSDVERESNRSIRAVVLGSYERGDRTLSITKAIKIAEFYAVPLSYLLEPPIPASGSDLALVVDLRRMRVILTQSDHATINSAPLRIIITYISGIVALRNDWNGEVLSLRMSDLTALAMATGKDSREIESLFKQNQLLLDAKLPDSL